MISQSTFERLQSVQRLEITLIGLGVLAGVAAVLAMLEYGLFAGLSFLLAGVLAYAVAKLLNLAGEILSRLDRLSSSERTGHPPTAVPPTSKL